MLQSDPNMKLYEQPASNLWLNSIAEMFIKPLPKRKWHEEVIGQAFISISSMSTIKNLCKSVILQNGVFQNGRIEFFVALPAADYVVGFRLSPTFADLISLIIIHLFSRRNRNWCVAQALRTTCTWREVSFFNYYSNTNFCWRSIGAHFFLGSP